jgi:hypothetical protein
MTLEQQRIALAEACPTIVRERHGKEIKWFWQDSLGTWWPCHRNDPLNDLNAMHEAEKVLVSRNNWELCDYVHKLHAATTGWPALATAAQRAEAFLRTLNLWTP